MAHKLIWGAALEITGIAGEIWLNGVRLYRASATSRRLYQTKLNPWVVEGDNHLRVTLGTLDGGPVPDGGAATFAAFVVEHGTVLTASDYLVTRSFPAKDVELAEHGISTFLEWPFRVPPARAFGRWAWEDAAAYAPSDRGDVLAIVEQLHRALAARDADRASTLVAVKMEELGRALGVPAAELVRDQREHWLRLFAADDYAVDGLSLGALVLEAQADGRLVTVTAADGRAPLRGGAADDTLALDVALARVAGQWVIVR